MKQSEKARKRESMGRRCRSGRRTENPSLLKLIVESAELWEELVGGLIEQQADVPLPIETDRVKSSAPGLIQSAAGEESVCGSVVRVATKTAGSVISIIVFVLNSH